MMSGSGTRTDSDDKLKSLFAPARQLVADEIVEQLADFRNKNDLGLLMICIKSLTCSFYCM